jgi:hypothetical protein
MVQFATTVPRWLEKTPYVPAELLPVIERPLQLRVMFSAVMLKQVAPLMLAFAVIGLTLERLATGARLPPGEVVVPEDLEARAATLALDAIQHSAG